MIRWGICQVKRTQITKVVANVEWFCEAKDGRFLEVQYGEVQLKPKDPSAHDFIVFENLTEQKVLEWVFDYVDKAEVEDRLTAVINEQKTPALVADIPWQNVIGE